jgi:hypothetical protein
MVIPSPAILTNAQQQWMIVLWQPFPVWISMFQIALEAGTNFVLGPEVKAYPSSLARNQDYLSAARRVYVFALTIATIAHVLSVGLSLTSYLLPHIFAPGIPQAFHPGAVFLPPWFLSKETVASLAAGVHSFLQYDEYVGCASALLWGLVQNREATSGKVNGNWWLSYFLRTTILTILAGPGAAFVALIWLRDERVLGWAEDEMKKEL